MGDSYSVGQIDNRITAVANSSSEQRNEDRAGRMVVQFEPTTVIVVIYGQTPASTQR
jgi:hypothetical protein